MAKVEIKAPVPVSIDEIEVDPEFKGALPIEPKTKQAIKSAIWENGFEEEYAVFLWEPEKGRRIIFDGHTRLECIIEHNARAAKESPEKVISTIPAHLFSLEDFPTRDDVLEKIFRNQFDRRNFTDEDLIYLLQVESDILEKRVTRGKGYRAIGGKNYEIIANYLNVPSASRVKRAMRVMREAQRKPWVKTDVQKILSGDRSITLNSIHDRIKEEETKEEREREREELRKRQLATEARLRDKYGSSIPEPEPQTVPDQEPSQVAGSIEIDDIDELVDPVNADLIVDDEIEDESDDNEIADPEPKKRIRGKNFTQNYPVRSATDFEKRSKQIDVLYVILSDLAKSKTDFDSVIDLFDYLIEDMLLFTKDERNLIHEKGRAVVRERLQSTEEASTVLERWSNATSD
jgi:hypothetical protein